MKDMPVLGSAGGGGTIALLLLEMKHIPVGDELADIIRTMPHNLGSLGVTHEIIVEAEELSCKYAALTEGFLQP